MRTQIADDLADLVLTDSNMQTVDHIDCDSPFCKPSILRALRASVRVLALTAWRLLSDRTIAGADSQRMDITKALPARQVPCKMLA